MIFQPGEVKEWFERAMKFHDFYREMAVMVDKFVNIPNRVLLYQLYNYVSDMRSVMSMVNSHIKWHGVLLGTLSGGFHSNRQVVVVVIIIIVIIIILGCIF